MAIALSDPNVDVFSTTANTTYSTASHTPPANALQIVFVSGAAATNQTPSTVTHGADGFTLIGDGINVTTTGRAHLYVRLTGSSPSAGTVSVTFPITMNGCGIITFSLTGVDVSGTAAAAIVQAPENSGTATSGSVTLAVAGNANNRPISFFVHQANEAKTERASWAEIGDGSHDLPNYGYEAQWRSDTFETTASATWTTSAPWAGIAAEVKAELAGAPAVARRLLLGVGT